MFFFGHVGKGVDQIFHRAVWFLVGKAGVSPAVISGSDGLYRNFFVLFVQPLLKKEGAFRREQTAAGKHLEQFAEYRQLVEIETAV